MHKEAPPVSVEKMDINGLLPIWWRRASARSHWLERLESLELLGLVILVALVTS